MKHICIFVLFLLLSSCEYFNVKKTSSDVYLNEELQTFNWNEVDTYPKFTTCDSIITKHQSKTCFQSIITKHILNALEDENLVVTQDIKDTIIIEFKISDKGKLTLLDTRIDSVTIQVIPNIKNLISESLDSLPDIFPAIKRGQQVTTMFSLPIIVNVN